MVLSWLSEQCRRRWAGCRGYIVGLNQAGISCAQLQKDPHAQELAAFICWRRNVALGQRGCGPEGCRSLTRAELTAMTGCIPPCMVPEARWRWPSASALATEQRVRRDHTL